MGYTTDFSGSFTLSKPLTPEQVAYLKQFNHTRRMRRDSAITATRPDPLREAVGLSVGRDGEFFVNEDGYAGQGDWSMDREKAGILDYNEPPSTQPGLWCQWGPTNDGTQIEWDGGEKFYNYVEWMNYIIENFLTPWGIEVEGEVFFQGEDREDYGKLVILNGKCRSNPSSLVELARCAGDLTSDDFEDEDD